jgi:hypothetical protein
MVTTSPTASPFSLVTTFKQSWAHRSYKLSERSKAMSDLWFSEWKKMSVERWVNCQKKEFAHRSKRSLNLKERAFWAVRSLSDLTMLSFLGLARRADVRQSRVWIPPGTPPLVQPRKIQEQKSIGAEFSQRSSRRVSPSPRMNIVSTL